jgi:hypothetical protein
MRRFILVFMMVLLPLQWSWAAAGSVCGHETHGGHFGHHQHQHEAAGGAAADDSDVSFANHPDCQACHGVCAGVLTAAADVGPRWSADRPVPAYSRYLPDPPVETLLRPPLPLVA